MDDLNLKTVAKKAFDLLWANAQSTNLSSDDRTPVEAFNANLQALEALLITFHDVARAESTEMRLRWNTSLPISKIPLELLVSVFDFDLDETWFDSEGTQLPARIHTLSSVSKSWYGVVQSTPSIWSKIRTSYPTNFIRTAIERSGRHGLTIDRDLSNSDSLQLEAMHSICGQISRWLCARLKVVSDGELQLLAGSAAPTLQNLDVVCLQTDDSARVPINFFANQAPALKDVALDGLHAVWTSPIFTNLHTLALYDVLGLTINQLIIILHHCPLLQHLTLCQLRLHVQPDTAPEKPPPVTLLNLKQLHVRECTNEILYSILASVHCPVADDIILTLPTSTHFSFDQQLLDLEPIIAFTAALIQRGVAAGELIGFDWKPTTYLFTFGETDVSGLFLDSSSSFEIHSGFVEALNKKAALSDLSLTLSGEGQGWSSLGSLDCVTGLIAVGENEIVTHLGTPIEDGDTVRWPFPRLKSLYLEGDVCEGAKDIVQMIQNRKGCQGVDFVGAKNLPRLLETLELEGDCPMDRDTLLELQTMAPEITVEWEPTNEAETAAAGVEDRVNPSEAV